jgi:hypothetical protein
MREKTRNGGWKCRPDGQEAQTRELGRVNYMIRKAMDGGMPRYPGNIDQMTWKCTPEGQEAETRMSGTVIQLVTKC